MNLTAFKEWMTAATTKEQTALAKAAKTSRPHLYQLANSHRKASADLAGRIAAAAARLRAKNPELPELRREQLAPACAACDYAKRCK